MLYSHPKIWYMKSIPLAFDSDSFQKCQQALGIHEIRVLDACLLGSVSYLNDLRLWIISLPFTALSPCEADSLHYAMLYKNPCD